MQLNYIIDEENDESVMVYTGRIKEKAILDKNYKECKWIGKRNLEDYNFLSLDKDVLNDFFAQF